MAAQDGRSIIKDADGKVVGCHATKAKAQAQLAALYANEKGSDMSKVEVRRPPRENVVRAISPGSFEIRDASDGKPKMIGHFAVFDEWTEVESMWEGHFMERNAPGAFAKTIKSNRDRIKVTLNHGGDPDLGDKVLGTIADMHEDDRGVAYEVDLFPSVPALVMDGLRASAYGSSYRFRVLREDWVAEPEASDHNPHGLPERTVKEAEVAEFGPVTYPQYDGATAGIRSMSDEYLFGNLTSDPKRLAEIIDYYRTSTSPTATAMPNVTTSYPPNVTVTVGTRSPITLGDIPSADKAPKPEDEPKKEAEPKKEDHMEVTEDLDRYNTPELLALRQDEINARLRYLDTEYAGRDLPTEIKTEWDGLKGERTKIEARIKHLEERKADLEGHEIKNVEPGDDRSDGGRVLTLDRGVPPKGPRNPWDLKEYRRTASSEQAESQMLKDGFKRALESTSMPQVKGYSEETLKEGALATFERIATSEHESYRAASLAAYFLAVGSPTYRRAFGKLALSAPAPAVYSPEEASALQQGQQYAERAFTLATTGIPIPFQLDPTVVPISNSSVNPYRAISRVEQVTVNNWRSATSAGITAHYDTEALEATDDTPTLAQPTINAVRATAFVPFSIESGQDWPALETEMTQEVASAKDDLEALKFTLGSGTNEPFGVVVGASTLVITTTTGTFVAADTFKLEEALPPRFRARASMIANRFILNKVRQFDTAGGATNWLPYPGLGQGLNNQVPTPGNVGYGILGYPTYEVSAMDAVLTTGSEIIVMGDFRYFVIIDRIGMSVDVIPHLVGTTHRPTGQRGLYYFWRNGSKVLNAAAFRTLQT